MFAFLNQRQDAERLSQWSRDHGRAVRGYVLALVRRADVADDITQEVFRKAWQARASYTENGTPRAYLLRIADRLVCDWSRRNRPELNLAAEDWEQVEPATSDDEVPQAMFLAEASEQLTAALERLSATQRRVLMLRYFGDLSFQQIADTMNCPLNTVLSHCHRALLAMRKLLAGKV